jgi:hypothetical protein
VTKRRFLKSIISHHFSLPSVRIHYLLHLPSLIFPCVSGNPSRINSQIAQQLRIAASNDLKQRSIGKANLMQARYESEVQDLVTKQQWYQKHQIGMTKEDELEYQRVCQEAQFRLHILEERLERFVRQIDHMARTNIVFLSVDTRNWPRRNSTNFRANSTKIHA